MKNNTAKVRNSRSQYRYVAMRVVLALGSLVTMVLASGAGSHWN